MSDLSSAKFCVDDAQIRRIIAPALEKIGSRRFPGRTEAARKLLLRSILLTRLFLS